MGYHLEEKMESIQVSVEEMYNGSQERYNAFLTVLDYSLNPPGGA